MASAATLGPPDPSRSNTLLAKAPDSAQVAQLVEQQIEDPRVGGSIPPLLTQRATPETLK
jgi:hypothetical protein